MFANSRRFSGTMEIPFETTSDVGIPVTTSPSSTTSPSVGLTYPRIVLRVVVFPLAFPPSRQTISPG